VLQIGTQSTNTPYAQINVQYGKRYRLRIVGALCAVCPTQLTIDGHKMLVIATDGSPVSPTTVDAIIIYSGNFLTDNWTKYTGNSRTEHITLLGVHHSYFLLDISVINPQTRTRTRRARRDGIIVKA